MILKCLLLVAALAVALLLSEDATQPVAKPPPSPMEEYKQIMFHNLYQKVYPIAPLPPQKKTYAMRVQNFLSQRLTVYTKALLALLTDAICITILIQVCNRIKAEICEIIHYVKNKLRNNDDCCICIGTEQDEWYQTRCGHNFHRSCISKWHRGTCPLCRARIGS
jgi:hypothetical protein